MTEPTTTLQAAREQTIDALCRRFADDTLSMPELERRLDRARSARTRDELRILLSDLPTPPIVPARSATAAGPPTRQPGRQPGRRPAAGQMAGQRHAPAQRRPGAEGDVRTSSSVALAVLGGTRRAGKWAPPENMLAFAVMGGVELDFRDAVLEPGSVTTINCFAFWGGIDITVPPDVHVDTGGFAVLGGFEQSGEAWDEPPEDAPTIRINGVALMGGVDVKVRDRGDSRSRSRGRRQIRRDHWEDR
jgi:hypothetical protein